MFRFLSTTMVIGLAAVVIPGIVPDVCVVFGAARWFGSRAPGR